MILPNSLNKGDKIGLVSTARYISRIELKTAIEVLEEWGLNVILGVNIFCNNEQFAGTDLERAADLQMMINDNSIKAILCTRGGYGTARIIDLIDFTNLFKYPKWIIGYSDITVLHTHINKLGLASLHATMPINFNTNTSNALKSMHACLFKQQQQITSPTYYLNKNGYVNAEIVGGNLSVIYSLLGSKSDIDTVGKILFLEDLDEYLYHIDRMVLNLKRNNKFSQLKGLIVGAMEDMHDNTISFGKSVNEIIYEHTSDYNFPICFNFPAGHISNNTSLILGKNSELEINNNNVNLLQ